MKKVGYTMVQVSNNISYLCDVDKRYCQCNTKFGCCNICSHLLAVIYCKHQCIPPEYISECYYLDKYLSFHSNNTVITPPINSLREGENEYLSLNKSQSSKRIKSTLKDGK